MKEVESQVSDLLIKAQRLGIKTREMTIDLSFALRSQGKEVRHELISEAILHTILDTAAALGKESEKLILYRLRTKILELAACDPHKIEREVSILLRRAAELQRESYKISGQIVDLLSFAGTKKSIHRLVDNVIDAMIAVQTSSYKRASAVRSRECRRLLALFPKRVAGKKSGQEKNEDGS